MTTPSDRKITRTRPSLNCLPCRARKVKCGRERGSCNACVKLKLACEYDRDAKRKGKHDSVEHESDVAAGGFALGGEIVGKDVETGVVTGLDVAKKRPRTTSTTWAAKAGDAGGSRSPSTSDDDNADMRVVSASRGQRDTPSDYLSVREGDRIRFISSSFWGHVAGYEELCESAIGDQASLSLNAPPSHIHMKSLTISLRFLPPKTVADALLQSFILRILPIYPLVHLPSLQAEYDVFWHWYGEGSTPHLPDHFQRDPTFVCLLFAILYTGAAAVPSELGDDSGSLGHIKSPVVDQLMVGFAATQSSCQHETHPTLNTLTAALLAWPWVHSSSDAAKDAEFVGSAVRVARGMGMHCAVRGEGIGEIKIALRRRVWRHVVWLDMENTVLHGCAPFCAADCASREFGKDEEEMDGDVSLWSPFLPGEKQSAGILLAIARYKVARFHHDLNGNLRISRNPLKQASELCTTLDNLAARLSNEPTTTDAAIVGFTNLGLRMLKFETLVTSQRYLLLSTNTTDSQRVWQSLAHASLDHLHSHHNLLTTPAFVAWRWHAANLAAPLRSAFLLLLSLRQPSIEYAPQIREVVVKVVGLLGKGEIDGVTVKTREAWDRVASMWNEVAVY